MAGRRSRTSTPGSVPGFTIICPVTMLDCSDFLQEYSGFRDGTLDEVRLAGMRAHLARCPACTRYDRVIEGGVDVLRGLPEIEPSDDFLPRLQHRIYHLEDGAALRERRASGASAVILGGIAFAIGATAWAPLIRSSGPPVVELPPMVAHAPHRVEALEHLFRAGPLLTGSDAEAAPRTLFHEYSPLGRFASSPLRAP